MVITAERVNYLRYYVDAKTLTLRDVIESYLIDYSYRHKITSAVSMERKLYRGLALFPRTMDTFILDLKISDFDIWIKKLDKKGTKEGNRIIDDVRKVFTFVKSFYGVEIKPALHCLPIKKSYEEATLRDDRIYTFEQFQTILKVVDSLKFRLVIELLFYTGVRIGELRALKWSDFKRDHVEILRSCSSSVGDGFTLLSPKTKKSGRLIPVPKILLYDLRQWKRIQSKHNKIGEFVFQSDKTYLGETSIKRALQLYAKKARLPYLPPHRWRHSCASFLMNECGADLNDIKEWLGHTSVIITSAIYCHTGLDKKYKILETIEKLTGN